MALLSRLFGSKKRSAAKSPEAFDNVPEFNPWRPVPLSADQVTVLVYRECEQRGRRLLFDSSTVRLVPCAPDVSGLIEVENETGFKYMRQRADAKQLGEMVFGAVAMAYGGPTCKVHIIRGSESGDPAGPDTLMLSRVFPVARSAGRRPRTHGSSGTSLDDSCSSTGSELSLLRLDGGGHPSPHHPRSSSMDCPPAAGRLSEDSGLSSVDSFMGPPSYLPTPYGTPLSAQGSGASLGSHGSLHRSARLRPIGSSDVMLPPRDDVTCPLRVTSRTRLAVGVLVTLAGPARSILEDTLLQYSVQLEHLLARLQQSIERAYHSRRSFVRAVHQATAAATQDMVNLLSAPRLPRPVWLGLTSDTVTSRQRQRLAELFVAELTSLIAQLDTKEHNCFISTLLTAVLTHHLHWVVTVAPRCGQAGKLAPPPAARTLVVGTRTALVRRLLLVLSYFVRQQLVSETMPWSFSPLRSASACAGGPDASCSSIASLRATDGRLSASSTTLRAAEEIAESLPSSSPAHQPPPPVMPASAAQSPRATLAVPASGRAVVGGTSAESAGVRSRSRFYVRLENGGYCCGDEDERVESPARSKFYRNLKDDVGVGAKQSISQRLKADNTEAGPGQTLPGQAEICVGLYETRTECDEGYSARADAVSVIDSVCDAVNLGAAERQPLRETASVLTSRETPSLVVTDTSECYRTDESPCPLTTNPTANKNCQVPVANIQPPSSNIEPAPLASLSPPGVPQSRSCEPLSRPPPLPAARRLSRSSADLRAPVRFLVGGDEETTDHTERFQNTAVDTSFVSPAIMTRGTQRIGANNPTAATTVSESSDDDSGFAGCERCSGLPAPAPTESSQDGAASSRSPSHPAGHTQLSRRHSDSIRDTSQYLRGYRSFRFSQPVSGRMRKARHVSDGGSPSPPVVSTPPPEPPPPPPPPQQSLPGRRPCRCSEGERMTTRLRKQTPLLETGRGGPGRQSLSPWSSAGGGCGIYVPDLPLWGCDSRLAWESRLRADLQAAAGSSGTAGLGGECACVLADTDACSVQVLSSHAFPVCDAPGGYSGGSGGIAVVFAPLVAGLVESVCAVHQAGAAAGLVLHHLESELAQLTSRAAELAQFLTNSSLANMQELTQLMAVDSNDVPLLLSAASVLCPEICCKYGISVR